MNGLDGCRHIYLLLPSLKFTIREFQGGKLHLCRKMKTMSYGFDKCTFCIKMLPLSKPNKLMALNYSSFA